MPSAFNFHLLPAPVAVLAFLSTVALGLAIALGAALSAATRRRQWATRLLLTGAGVAAMYLGAWLGFALASRDATLPRGHEKYFCEIDCHLAYAVTDVQPDAQLSGVSPERGAFWLVRLRTRFDEQTISARRGKERTLTPNPRAIAIVDAAGHSYSPAAVPLAPELPATDLMTPLRPGESYETTLVFDLPRDVQAPRLLVREAIPEAPLLIDNETSYRHGKTYFELAS